MKKQLRFLVLIALTIGLLTGSALADSGPKPLLTVRVKNAPQELYYLDLVAEGEYEGHSYGSGESEYSGIDWSYTEEEAAALDADLLDALRAAVPEGYHACTAEGTGGAPMWGDLEGEDSGRQGVRLHTFGYFGLPDTYRILIATADGDTYVFPPCTRTALQSSVTVDWEMKSVEVPPAWISYVLQFLCTLLPTLVIEGVVLVLFGFSWKRNRKPFLLVNLVTQGALAVYFSITAVQSGVGFWYFFLLIPAEIVIAFVEGGLYTRLLAGQSRRRAFAYGITANLSSALLGLLTVEPLWRWIVSIS